MCTLDCYLHSFLGGFMRKKEVWRSMQIMIFLSETDPESKTCILFQNNFFINETQGSSPYYDLKWFKK